MKIIWKQPEGYICKAIYSNSLCWSKWHWRDYERESALLFTVYTPFFFCKINKFTYYLCKRENNFKKALYSRNKEAVFVYDRPSSKYQNKV